MRYLATQQFANQSAKQNQSSEKARSRPVSPLSTGMPMLQRQCACGGGCPRCQNDLAIQTKLKIGEPGDRYEQEADRIAAEVMQMPEPTVQRQIEGEEEDEEMMQRQAIASTPVETNTDAPSIVHSVLHSASQPLDAATRAFMETRFDHDFSQVQIHTDTQAAESARAVHANAYTVGNHIVFSNGKFDPHSASGKSLLAHELVHVMQQQSGRVQHAL